MWVMRFIQCNNTRRQRKELTSYPNNQQGTKTSMTSIFFFTRTSTTRRSSINKTRTSHLSYGGITLSLRDVAGADWAGHASPGSGRESARGEDERERRRRTARAVSRVKCARRRRGDGGAAFICKVRFLP